MNRLAEQLAAHAVNSQRWTATGKGQVHLRRAQSAAYYAVFHALGDELARCFRREVRGSAARLLKHGVAKTNATTIYSQGMILTVGQGIACPATLKQVAQDFVQLQEDRHLADDSVAKTFARREGLQSVEKAERAVMALRSARRTCPMELEAFLIALLGAKHPFAT